MPAGDDDRCGMSYEDESDMKRFIYHHSPGSVVFGITGIDSSTAAEMRICSFIFPYSFTESQSHRAFISNNIYTAL